MPPVGPSPQGGEALPRAPRADRGPAQHGPFLGAGSGSFLGELGGPQPQGHSPGAQGPGPCGLGAAGGLPLLIPELPPRRGRGQPPPLPSPVSSASAGPESRPPGASGRGKFCTSRCWSSGRAACSRKAGGQPGSSPPPPTPAHFPPAAESQPAPAPAADFRRVQPLLVELLPSRRPSCPQREDAALENHQAGKREQPVPREA